MIVTTLALLIASAQAAPQRPRPCSAPVHRQFDFWLGAWDVTTADGKFAGTNRIELVDGGCALFESWSSGGGGYTGRSLNSVGGDGRWRQTWVDSSGLRLELVGGLVDGKMVLEGETPASAAGRTPDEEPDHLEPRGRGPRRQHWETSDDGGKTYTPAFDGMYHPVKSAVTEQDELPAPARGRLDRHRHRDEARGARRAHGHARAGRALRPAAVGQQRRQRRTPAVRRPGDLRGARGRDPRRDLVGLAGRAPRRHRDRRRLGPDGALGRAGARRSTDCWRRARSRSSTA